MWITDKWRKMKEENRVEREREKNAKTQFEAAKAAIEGGDMNALLRAFAGIEDMKDFLQRRHYICNGQFYDDLLKTAVRGKNLALFTEVFQFGGGDPNVVLVTLGEPVDAGRLVFYPETKSPLLNYAIENHSHDIALEIAKNPRTDIMQRTIHPRATRDGGNYYGDEPRLLAKDYGMMDIYAVLAQRHAASLRAAAEHVEVEAKKYMGGPV